MARCCLSSIQTLIKVSNMTDFEISVNIALASRTKSHADAVIIKDIIMKAHEQAIKEAADNDALGIFKEYLELMKLPDDNFTKEERSQVMLKYYKAMQEFGH
jgi:hypothetical protein